MRQTLPFLVPPAPLPADESSLRAPSWVHALAGKPGVTLPGEGFSLDVCQGEGHCFVSVRAPAARSLDRSSFQEAIVRVYRRIEAELRARGTVHPVRLWNHLPGIHDPMGDGLDRYMVFNAGRYAALSEWFGGRETFGTRVASASGIGHRGEDLVIQCLAASRPGEAVANPRQVAPYRYSSKYGPRPPCFARATVIQSGGSAWVLVGGTASIVGESSLHCGDLEEQVEETLTNLAVLLLAAAGRPATETEDRAALLERYREVRVYYPDPGHLDALRRRLPDAFPRARSIEWVRADLCRADLLVEIEGVAELPAWLPS